MNTEFVVLGDVWVVRPLIHFLCLSGFVVCSNVTFGLNLEKCESGSQV